MACRLLCAFLVVTTSVYAADGATKTASSLAKQLHEQLNELANLDTEQKKVKSVLVQATMDLQGEQTSFESKSKQLNDVRSQQVLTLKELAGATQELSDAKLALRTLQDELKSLDPLKPKQQAANDALAAFEEASTRKTDAEKKLANARQDVTEKLKAIEVGVGEFVTATTAAKAAGSGGDDAAKTAAQERFQKVQVLLLNLNHELAAARSAESKADTMLLMLTDEVNHSEVAKQLADSELKALSDAHSTAEEKVTQANGAVQTSITKSTRLTEQSESLSKTYSQDEAALSDVKESIAELTKNIDNHRDEIAGFDTDIETCNKSIADTKAELKELDRQAATVNDPVATGKRAALGDDDPPPTAPKVEAAPTPTAAPAAAENFGLKDTLITWAKVHIKGGDPRIVARKLLELHNNRIKFIDDNALDVDELKDAKKAYFDEFDRIVGAVNGICQDGPGFSQCSSWMNFITLAFDKQRMKEAGYTGTKDDFRKAIVGIRDALAFIAENRLEPEKRPIALPNSGSAAANGNSASPGGTIFGGGMSAEELDLKLRIRRDYFHDARERREDFFRKERKRWDLTREYLFDMGKL